MKIAIVGKKNDTVNYVNYVTANGGIPIVTLSPGEASDCDAMILPGGGDITPAFFGEQNHGSKNIDTELDIFQLQAFHLALQKKMPVLGICKGMQLINVGFGGTITQHLKSAALHQYQDGDQYHITNIAENSFLHNLYGATCIVNSAHHQAIHRLGKNLQAIQSCPLDNCVEAICHTTLPVIGLQWHPERINFHRSGVDGTKLIAYFFSLISEN